MFLQEEPRFARSVLNNLGKGVCTQKGGYLLDSFWVLTMTFHKIFSYMLFCRFIVLSFNFWTMIHCNHCGRSKVRDHIHFLSVDTDKQLFQYHLMKISRQEKSPGEVKCNSLPGKWQLPAWEIPRTEEPGGLQSRGLQRVEHDLVIE